MQQSEEVGHYIFYLVCNKHLVAIELNFIAVNVEIALYTREVEHTCEVERIVYVQVNPKQRLIAHRIQLCVKLFIIFVL